MGFDLSEELKEIPDCEFLLHLRFNHLENREEDGRLEVRVNSYQADELPCDDGFCFLIPSEALLTTKPNQMQILDKVSPQPLLLASIRLQVQTLRAAVESNPFLMQLRTANASQVRL